MATTRTASTYSRISGLACLLATLMFGVGAASTSDAFVSAKKPPKPKRTTSTTTNTTAKVSTTNTTVSKTTLATAVPTYQLEVRTETFVDKARNTPATSASAAVASRTLPTMIVTPHGSSSQERFPLLVFSHGLGGSPSAYEVLLRAIAQAGFVVAAPTFPLSNSKSPGGPQISDEPNQPGDVSFVITQLLKDRAVDPEKVVVAGHSLGGITTVDLIGNPKLIDKRIDAAIVISGTANIFSGVRMFVDTPPFPVLFLHGDKDETVPYSLGMSTYQAAKAPKWLMTVVNGDHIFGIAGDPSRRVSTGALYVQALTRFAKATLSSSDQTVALKALVDANPAALKLEQQTR